MGLAHACVASRRASHFPGLLAEQGTFLLSGLLVWISAFGGEHRKPRKPECRWSGSSPAHIDAHDSAWRAARAGASALYAHAGGLSGLTPLEDQHLGGAIMLIAGGLSYLIGGLVLAAGLFRVGSHQLERA